MERLAPTIEIQQLFQYCNDIETCTEEYEEYEEYEEEVFEEDDDDDEDDDYDEEGDDMDSSNLIGSSDEER
jgi:hypothetical protein